MRRLKPCPKSPNCVSSEAADADHRIAPLALEMPAEKAWPIVREVVGGWPRTRILVEEADYLHAECVTALVRFVDDLELLLNAERSEIAVRSASRVGWWDLGTNHRRVAALAGELRRRGAVR